MRNFGEQRKPEIDLFQLLSNIVSVIFLVCVISLGCFIYAKETSKIQHNSEKSQIEILPEAAKTKITKFQNEIGEADRAWLSNTINGDQ